MGMSPRLKARRGRFGPGGLVPSVSITSAVVNTIVGSPTTYTIDLAGEAADDGVDVSASIVWTSDVDGALGTGATVSGAALTAGPHVITATVTAATGSPADVVTATTNVTAA